jgi:tetratricopeptide (TPR) repeat protein
MQDSEIIENEMKKAFRELVINKVVNKVIENVLAPKLVFFVGAGISASSIGTFKEINKKILRLTIGDILSVGEGEVLSEIRPEVMLQIFLSYEEFKHEIFKYLQSIMMKANPNYYHFFLAEVLRQGNFVFTTNYDQLIEEACRRKGIDYDVYYTNDHFDEFVREYLKKKYLPQKGCIFKLHGSIEDPNSILATLRQVGKGLHPAKEAVIRYFLQNFNFCFIGYSCLDDFDLLPVLLNTPSPKNALWFKYAKGGMGGIIWSKEILQSEKKREENKPLGEKKDWETVNLNEFLLRRQYFLKVIGDASQFIKENFFSFTEHSINHDTSHNKNERLGEGGKEIDYYIKSLVAGRLYLQLELFNKARDYFQKAETYTEDKFKKAIAQKWLANSYYIAEEGYDKAVEILRQKVLPVYQGDYFEAASIKIDIANNLRRLRNFPEALEYAKEAKQLLENKRDEIVKEKGEEEYELEYARSLNILGLIRYGGRDTSNPLPDIEEAIKLCEEGRKIREHYGDQSAVADSENSIGLFYYEKANYLSKSNKKEAVRILTEVSLPYLERAKGKKERVGDYRGLEQIYRNLGLVYELLTKLVPEEKEKYLLKLVKAYDELVNSMRRIKEPPKGRFLEAQYRMATTYLMFKKSVEAEKAIEILTEVIRERRKVGDWHNEARALDKLREAYEVIGQQKECERCCDNIVSIYQWVLSNKDELKKLKEEKVKFDNATKEILPNAQNFLKKIGSHLKAKKVASVLKEIEEKVMTEQQ